MALKLNTSRKAYKEFWGSNVEQMPRLVADRRVPMSVAQLMQIRLDVRNSDKKIKDFYMNNYFDTGDAIIYHPDGRMKIVLDSYILKKMPSGIPRNAGALVLTPEQYEVEQGKEFKKGELGKINKEMSEAEVKSHPVWKVLARNQRRLNNYASYVFGEGKEEFGYDAAMGIFLEFCRGDNPEMRAWGVGCLEDLSSVDGWNALDVDIGRLIGVSLEAILKKD